MWSTQSFLQKRLSINLIFQNTKKMCPTTGCYVSYSCIPINTTFVIYTFFWVDHTAIQNVHKLEKKLLAAKLVFYSCTKNWIFYGCTQNCFSIVVLLFQKKVWKWFCVMLKVSHLARPLFHEEKWGNELTFMQSHKRPFQMESETWFFAKCKKSCP